jgi:hypothetical protein
MMNYNVAQPSYALKPNTQLLKFSWPTVVINRGSFLANSVCIKPEAGNFVQDVAFTMQKSIFSLNPANMTAAIGQNETCGDLGTPSTTEPSDYTAYWTKYGGDKYSGLPPLSVTVTDQKSVITVAKSVKCSKGGRSVPIIVSVDNIPYDDI